MAAYERLLEALLDWPWNLITGSALAAIISGLRFSKKTWPLAFSLGGLTVGAIERIFSYRRHRTHGME